MGRRKAGPDWVYTRQSCPEEAHLIDAFADTVRLHAPAREWAVVSRTRPSTPATPSTAPARKRPQSARVRRPGAPRFMCGTEASKAKNSFRKGPPAPESHAPDVPAYMSTRGLFAEEATGTRRCRPSSAPMRRRVSSSARPSTAKSTRGDASGAVQPRGGFAVAQARFEAKAMSKGLREQMVRDTPRTERGGPAPKRPQALPLSTGSNFELSWDDKEASNGLQTRVQSGAQYRQEPRGRAGAVADPLRGAKGLRERLQLYKQGQECTRAKQTGGWMGGSWVGSPPWSDEID